MKCTRVLGAPHRNPFPRRRPRPPEIAGRKFDRGISGRDHEANFAAVGSGYADQIAEKFCGGGMGLRCGPPPPLCNFRAGPWPEIT